MYKGFTKVGNILPDTLKQHKLNKALKKHQVAQVWGLIAPGFFEEAAELTKALSFEQGRLTIACLSYELAQKIIATAKEIISAINEVLGKKLVYVISVEY